MPYYDVLLLAVALAMDAALVSFTYGLITKSQRLKTSLSLSLSTGFAQGIMPVGGYFLARSISHFMADYDHWFSFIVFLFLGLKVIWDAFKGEESEHPALTFKILLLIAFATSIDAFVAGSTLYFTKTSLLLSTMTIGLVTVMFSLFGFYFTKTLNRFSPKVLGLFAGGLLILLGIKVLYEHTLLP